MMIIGKNRHLRNSAANETEHLMQFMQRDQQNTEILIYGEIREKDQWDVVLGDTPSRVGAYDFASALNQVTTPEVTVRINSAGGDASAGIAIYNLLKTCGKKVTTIIDGMACSAASVIFCAGANRIMFNAGTFMIHPVWTYAGSGNAEYFRALADELDVGTQPSIEIYKTATGLPEEDVKQLVRGSTGNGTWMTAKTALQYGFATEIRESEAQQSMTMQAINALVEECEDLRNQLTKRPEAPVCAWSQFINAKRGR